MQIIDLYIRGGKKYNGVASFPTPTRLVDTSVDFLNGEYSVGQIIKDLSTGIVGNITGIVDSSTLDILGGIFSGSEKPYQIYDDFTKLELFKDESVSITDTIQNVKDPEKIFAPFSQQFSVPASKSNNRFFKHYYDVDVQNSFDARYQGDGLIQLNGVNYKSGKIRLTSVELKDNVAYSYKLVFTGATIEFKDILAEAELSSLVFPDELNIDYTNDEVKDIFTGDAGSQDLAFPLITHSKNMRFKNGEYKDHITDTYLNFADLKPALRLKKIIDAIQTTYPQLRFSDEYFNTFWFKKLYMWLHREEGYLSNSDEGGAIRTISTRFFRPDNAENQDTNYNYVNNPIGADLRPARCYVDNGSGSWFDRRNVGYIFTLTVTSPDPNRIYEVEVLRSSDNAPLFSQTGTGTTQTFEYEADINNYGLNEVDVFFNISSDSTLGMTQNLTVQQVKKRIWGGSAPQVIRTALYDKQAPISETQLSINRQMPKMKIIDFLKNLFTMHNLTAYTEDGLITVLHLDDFYNQGVSYDITRYVDTKKSTVSKLLQFKNMLFDFKSKKSYLVQFSQELQGNKFSEESYGNDEWDGGDYKIEVDFEKMMYERLTDEATGRLTKVTQGAMLDKKFEPTIGQPLIMYILPNALQSVDFIKWDNSDGTFENINNYSRPANGYAASFDNATVYRTLNFGIENDEFTQSSDSLNNIPQDLYTKYYRNYVENLFSRNSRKTNLSAYLPLNIILKYKLNDVFIISNTQYRINSIKTNLLTNKSDLELYNLNTSVEQRSGGQSPFLRTVENIVVDNIQPDEIEISFDDVDIPTQTDFVGYAFYLDGDLIDEPDDSLTYTYINLEEDTTYKLGVAQVQNTIDNVKTYSIPTEIFVTTAP
tara:strand:- start:2001 stop:4628 length:2628 start_codon:yes stop_codon:yes gene_type:complete